MLTLKALGALDLRNDDGQPLDAVLTQGKRAALLAYLAISHPGQFHRRDPLLALFWPDLDQSRGRNALSQALSFLRREAGERIVVTRGADEVGVDATQVRCDVAAFLEAVEDRRWGDALDLYQGDLLEGLHVVGAPPFADWMDRERYRLREAAAAAAWEHAHDLIRSGRLVEAERTAERAIELVATDESPVRDFIEAMAHGGDRGAALRFYARFKALLASELEVEPAPETEAVAEAVRNGQMGMVGLSHGDPPTPEGRTDPDPLPAPSTLPAGSVRGSRRPWHLGVWAGVALVAGAAALGSWLIPGPHGRDGNSPPRSVIAVLPFRNLSGDGPHASFAGALHEEVMTQLSKVSALTVMGRTSVMSYQGTERPLREFARDLRVGSVLEGSVQVQGESLRVNVQLLDAASGAQLWSERYDRTLEDAFAIQSQIARQVVAVVGATLTGAEARAMAAAPTENPEAYLLYLQAIEYWQRVDYLPRNLGIAQDLLEQAIALDSTFALAHAALSQVHGFISWWRYDPSPARLARQREAAEAALRFAPALPQAHTALGAVHYFGNRDWGAALKEYEIALAGLPNDAEVWAMIGYAHRRLGNLDDVLVSLERAVALEPRDPDILWDLGGETTRRHRRFKEAKEWYDRSLALAPDLAHADVGRGLNWVAWQGRSDSLWAALARHPVDAIPLSWGTNNALRLHWERHPDSLLALLRRMPQPVVESQLSYLPLPLYAAWAHQQAKARSAASLAFDSALVLLDSAMAVLPDDWRVHAALGLALAGLGRGQEALREARWLQQSRTYREDAHFGPHVAERRAQILAAAGATDQAIEEIERLLAGPSWTTVHTLRLDPLWDPIRQDPRFQALLLRYADPGSA